MMRSVQVGKRSPKEVSRLGDAVAIGWRTSVVMAALVCLWRADAADALTACSAADVSAQDTGCPVGSGACNINRDYEMPGDCVFDFGARSVTLNGTLRSGFHMLSVFAGDFSVSASGFIDGRGLEASGQGRRGGQVTIVAGSAISVARAGSAKGRIDVSGNSRGGRVWLNAAGPMSVAGRLLASGLTGDGGGGAVVLTTAAAISTDAASSIEATGGASSPGGGSVRFESSRDVTILGPIDVSGSSGGSLEISAGGAVKLAAVNADATGGGDAFSLDGGDVKVKAGDLIEVVGRIDASGKTSSSVDTEGGDGGSVDLTSAWGGVTVDADVIVEGGEPDGDGGAIDVQSQGVTTLAAAKKMSVRTTAAQGHGGHIEVDAGHAPMSGTAAAIVINGILDTTGKGGGGYVDLASDGGATITGVVRTYGDAAGSDGGDVSVTSAFGTVTLGGSVDATGGRCTADAGCGSGGDVTLDGCSVTMPASGEVATRAPAGGNVSLSAREQLTVAGTISAAKTVASGTDGEASLAYPSRKPPVLAGSHVTPSATTSAMATCTGPGQSDCLDPCPVCGNGALEYPESCDSGGGAPGCCNSLCVVEDCDDGRACTQDSCVTMTGCRYVSAPAACLEAATLTPTPTTTPTPTPTGQTPVQQPTKTSDKPTPVESETPGTGEPTATSTTSPSAVFTASPSASPTASPTQALTASATATIAVATATNTPSATASATWTWTPTPPASATPTLPPTATPTPVPSPTVAATLTPTALPSATPPASATPTHSPSPRPTATRAPTVTATPDLPPTPTRTTDAGACAGDCDGDGQVVVNELITLVNIALGTAPADACAAGDGNHDAEVTIDEILTAVNRALSGC